MNLKELVESLSDTEYYVSLHDTKGHRFAGGFVFTPSIELEKYYDWEVIDVSNRNDIVIAVVTPPQAKKARKK